MGKKRKVERKKTDRPHAIGQGTTTGGNEFNWSTPLSSSSSCLPLVRCKGVGGWGHRKKEERVGGKKKGDRSPTREIGMGGGSGSQR